MREHRPFRLVLIAILGCALLAAGCGGQLTDEEILRASGARMSASGGQLTSSNGSADAALDVPGGVEVPGGAATLPSGSVPGSSAGVSADPAAGASRAVGTPGETGPIVLASVGTYSGAVGLLLNGIPRGVQVWAQSVNARGGLFGREVRVIVADDGGDPAQQASIVRDLVENRGVVAFLGQAAPVSLSGSLPYLESKGIPVIGTECAQLLAYSSAAVFPQCPKPDIPWMTAFMRYAGQSTGKQKVGVLYCIESDICSGGAKNAVPAAEQVGMQVVYQAGVSLTQLDFTSQCQGAKNAGVELLLGGVDPSSLDRIARSCTRQGFRPIYIQIHVTSNRKSVNTDGLADLVSAQVTFPFTGWDSAPYQEFSGAMSAAGVEPGGAESLGWAAAKVFELAAFKAAQASGSISSQTLITALRTMKDETVGGLTAPLDFTGPTPVVTPCLFPMRGDGAGGWTAPTSGQMVC